MTVKIQKYGSRLKHAALLLVDGVEFWGRPDLPDLPESTGDKYHTVLEGERLDTIAKKYYRKSDYRWVIAHANNLGVMTTETIVGRQLRIPDPAVVRRLLLV